MKKTSIIIIGALVLIVALAIIFMQPTTAPVVNETPHNSRIPSTFAECVAAGYPVAESNPRLCSVPNGPTFTEELPNVPPTSVTPPDTSLKDLIQVTSPKPQATLTSPFTVSGKARGTWYFEASFPVTLKDANGKTLVETHAEAQGEWMTAEFVPFTLTLNFSQPETKTGTLILYKDNPSGLPENDRRLEIPVRFETE